MINIISNNWYAEYVELTEYGDTVIISSLLNSSAKKIKLTKFDIEGDYIQETEIKFRYSVDGINWSDWILTHHNSNPNIEFDTIDGSFYIDTAIKSLTNNTVQVLGFRFYSYTQLFQISTVQLDSTYLQKFQQAQVLRQSICANLISKIKSDKILPKFIDKTSADFDVFWKSIVCFFATILSYSYVFQRIILDRDLLLEYLTQFDLLNCTKNETLYNMQQYTANLLTEFGKRGTKHIFEPGGEIRRILCVDNCDEFIYGIINKYNSPFSINKNSVLYKGTRQDNLLLKPLSKTGWPNVILFGDDVVGVRDDIIVIDDNKNCSGGIGFENDAKYKIGHVIVDPLQSYEILFDIQAESEKVNINLGVAFYDCADNQYGYKQFGPIKIYKEQGRQIISAIIYGYNEQIAAQKLNTNTGQNIKFNSLLIQALYPKICIIGDIEPGELYIYNIQIRPLSYKRNKAFVNNSNFIDIFVKNKSNKDIDFVQREISNKLIPYGSNLFINEIK